MVTERLDIRNSREVEVTERRYRFALDRLDRAEKVMDAACGTGFGTHILAQKCEVLGIDRSREALDIARWEMGYAGLYLQMDLALIPTDFFRYFDAVVSLETLEHLKYPKAFLWKIAQAGCGHLILTTPIVPTRHFNPYHLHDFTQEQVLGWLAEQGYQVLEQQTLEGIYLAVDARRAG